MKAVFDKETHYYKYIYTDYSSGNAGGMYHYWDEYRAGATCAVKQMPQPMIITSVVMQIGAWTNEFHDGYVCNIHIQASQDNINWVNVKAFGDRTGCNTWHTLDMSDNTTAYNYYRFYAENGGWAYNDALSVASVEYKGYYVTINEVQEGEPYDYEIIGGKAYIVKEDVRKYYKYLAWEQPILSSNETMGGTNFACNQSNSYNSTTVAWRVFNGNSTTKDESNRWQINDISTSSWYWLSWYNPNPILIKGLTIYNNEATYVVKAYKIQGSNDNSNWADIVTGTNTNTTELGTWQIDMSNNSTQYTYFRIYCQPNSSTSLQISEIQINAKVVTESIPDDYDFYKDVDVYKAIKSYEKGQYYGN